MKNIKYSLLLGLAVAGFMLLTACQNVFNQSADETAAKPGYGLVKIITTDENGRTILPPVGPDTDYDYTFKDNTDTELATQPEKNDDGYFEIPLNGGDNIYKVSVKAYIGSGASKILAATGEEEFTVVSTNATEVKVALTPESTGNGKFSYTISYPANATLTPTLVPWPSGTGVSLTQTVNEAKTSSTQAPIDLAAGSYLFTISVSTDTHYAGLIEAVHIIPGLTTDYTMDFTAADMAEFNKYVVTFDKNDGSTGAAAIHATKTVTSPPKTTIDALPNEPTKTDTTFVEWNTKADGSGTKFDDTTPVEASITVYAKWDDISISFTGVTANGSDTQTTTTALTLTFSGAITGLTADDITLSGVDGVNKGTLSGSGPTYTLGITTTAAGTLNVAVAKAGYNISGSPQTTTIYVAAPVQITDPVTITFNANGGSDVDKVTIQKDTNMGSQYPSAPTKAGYIFDGWWDTTGNNFIEYLSDTPVSANVEVTAKWVSAYTADNNYEVPLTGVKVKNTEKLQAVGDSGMWIPLTFPAGFEIGAYDAFTIVLRAYNDSGARITSGITWGWIRFGFTKSMSSTGSVVITTPDLAAGKGSIYFNYGANTTIGTNQSFAADGGDPVNYIPAAFAFLVDNSGFDIKYMALESLTFRRRTAAAAPSITTQPKSQVFEAGDEINTLSVVANVIDNGDLTYQWYSADAIVGGTTTLINNATNATYDPPIDSENDSGDYFYYVVVTNTNNKALTTTTASTTSARVKITDVIPPPAITVDFTGKTITSLGGGASGDVLSDNTGFTYTNTDNSGHGLKFTVDIGSAKLSDYDNITFTMTGGTGDTNYKDIYLRGAASLSGTSTSNNLISTEQKVQYADPSKVMKFTIDKAATNSLTGTIEIGIVLSYSTAASWTIKDFKLNP